jgi:transaldolase
MTDSLARLRAAGVSIWLDDLSRDRLISGSLAVLARDKHVSGVTTNPTIFARSIIDSNAYTGQLRDLRVRQAAPDQALRELTTSDVRCACDVLRTVYDATEGVDGRVSIEVDPRFAYDPERTVAEARTLWWLVDRPNLFVKIPAVKQGLPAISGCLAEGISINVTLIFSLARYAEVIEAFLTGLEGARAAGRDLSGIASVASFFVSRVDTEVDRRLLKVASPDGQPRQPDWYRLVLAPGSLTRTLPVSGLLAQAKGFKNIAEALYLGDRPSRWVSRVIIWWPRSAITA